MNKLIAVSLFSAMTALASAASSQPVVLMWDDVQQVPLAKDAKGQLYSCKDRGATIQYELPNAFKDPKPWRCAVVHQLKPNEDKGLVVPMTLEDIVKTHVVAPEGRSVVAAGIIPIMVTGRAAPSRPDPASAWVAVRFR